MDNQIENRENFKKITEGPMFNMAIACLIIGVFFLGIHVIYASFLNNPEANTIVEDLIESEQQKHPDTSINDDIALMNIKHNIRAIIIFDSFLILSGSICVVMYISGKKLLKQKKSYTLMLAVAGVVFLVTDAAWFISETRENPNMMVVFSTFLALFLIHYGICAKKVEKEEEK